MAFLAATFAIGLAAATGGAAGATGKAPGVRIPDVAQAAVGEPRAGATAPPANATVVLTVGSTLARLGSRQVRLRAAPVLRHGTVLAPLGVLLWLTGAQSRWERSTRQLRVATARSELVFQVGRRRYALNGRLQLARAAPSMVNRVLLVPLGAVAAAFGLFVHQRTTGTLTIGHVAPMVVIGPGGGGGGGGGGSGGSGGTGGSGGGQPVTKTITTVYGWKGQPLVPGLNGNNSCNVPDAPSYLGGFALGSCTAGSQPSNDPGQGIANLGAAVFGVAAGEADQPMQLAYTSQAPAGVTSTLSVTAIVDSADTTYGISGAGGSCAPTAVNWSAPTGSSTDTLSTCLSSFQAVIPLGDAGSVTSAVLSSAAQLWGGLSGSEQSCVDTTQQGTAGASCALGAASTLMSAAGTGLSVGLHQSRFSWSGTTTGGATSYLTVDPEVQVSDVGLGTELNFITSYVLYVVTEQYSENQYSWSFPTAEVGQPLISPWLQQCATSSPLSCRLVSGSGAQVTSGGLPPGMSVGSRGGDLVVTGSPADGAEGAYQFSLQVAGGNLFDCTIDVAPPLALRQQGSTSTFFYETGVGFASSRALVLPFDVTGGVDGPTWALVGNPPFLGVSYSPATSASPGSPPVLDASGQVPASGSYSFSLQAWDNYTSVTSGPLRVVIVPKLSLSEGSQEAVAGMPYRWGLSALDSGGASPLSFEVDDCQACGALPPGLSLDRQSGLVSGVPSADGSYHFVVAVTDALGATATAQMSLVVYSLNQQPLAVDPASLPAGSVGKAYSETLEAAGAGTPPFSWKITAGALPPGVDLAVASSKPWYGAKATISGTPTRAGSFSFTVSLTDSKGRMASRTYTIRA